MVCYCSFNTIICNIKLRWYCIMEVNKRTLSSKWHRLAVMYPAAVTEHRESDCLWASSAAELTLQPTNKLHSHVHTQRKASFKLTLTTRVRPQSVPLGHKLSMGEIPDGRFLCQREQTACATAQSDFILSSISSCFTLLVHTLFSAPLQSWRDSSCYVSVSSFPLLLSLCLP